MADARRAISEADRARVAEAVARAEQATAAEIVCAVASESGRYDRAEAVVGLLGAVLALAGLHALRAPLLTALGGEAGALPLAFQVGAVLAGFFLGNLLASGVHPLRSFFVGRQEADEEVSRAAGYLFQARRLASTRARGGVLVYVSLFEREVVLLADEGAHAALGDQGLLEVRDQVVARLAARDLPGAFVAAAEGLGQRLKEALPRAPEDQDELPDALLVLHPRP